MPRFAEYLVYLIYPIVIGGSLAVIFGFVYGGYALFKKSVLSGLLILGGSAAGAFMLYLAALALIAVAAFMTDSANGPSGS